jgi:hypothetical protein
MGVPTSSNATPVITRVTSAAATTTLGSVNNTLSRRVMTFFNESTAILYLAWGPGATPTNYTVQIAAGGYYEMPRPTYRGIVTGYWAAANGFVQVTEA